MTNKWKDGRPSVGEECEIAVIDRGGLGLTGARRMTKSNFQLTRDYVNHLREKATKLQAENAKLQQELKDSDEDLVVTQKSLSKLETEFESISLVFCDSEGDPDFEPFNAENLSIWLKRFEIKQQAKGVFDLLNDASNSDVRYDTVSDLVLFGAERVKVLRQQAKGE